VLSLVIEILAAILAAGGVFVFVVFRLYYTQFYGRLSINPSDVGLSYANILANWSFAVQPPAAVQAACTWRISAMVGVEG